MRRTEHSIARAIATVGLASSFTYLGWRVAFSLAGTDLWLSIPVILIEIAGFVGSAILVWALWPRMGHSGHSGHPGHPGHPGMRAEYTASGAAVHVVVRVNEHSGHELQATLLALRSVSQVHRVGVVDLSNQPDIAPDIAALASDFGADYTTVDSSDCSGMFAAVATASTPRFLLLDAGDIPTTDIVNRLTRVFADERVAIAQGLGVSFADDSIEHGPDGRHDLTFERVSLNPILGTRGCAFWTGSGSLVSVDALREAMVGLKPVAGATALDVHWATSGVLMSAGWLIVAPADVAVVAQRVEHNESVVYADRRARVRSARRLVAGCRRPLSMRQRLSVLAWCVRPLSGIRRAAFVAVVVVAIYAGATPFNASLTMMLIAWSPGIVGTSLGLALLSGWRLHPGDRARWSLLSIGPACSSWRSTMSPITPTSGSQFGVGLVIAITSMCVVLVLRGISDLFTHALDEMPRDVLLGLLVVALWTLAVSLDVLGLLSRRPPARRSARVAASLTAALDERSVTIVDVTPHGAGLLSQTSVAIGESLQLVATVNTVSGETPLSVRCVVSSVTAVDRDSWRIGVKFGEVDTALASALVEFCSVEPMWERLGVMPETSVTEARRISYLREPDDDVFVGRGILRLLAIVAVVAAATSSVSGRVSWLEWIVAGFAAAIGVSIVFGAVGWRVVQPSSLRSSSFSPDLAIR